MIVIVVAVVSLFSGGVGRVTSPTYASTKYLQGKQQTQHKHHNIRQHKTTTTTNKKRNKTERTHTKTETEATQDNTQHIKHNRRQKTSKQRDAQHRE